LSAASGKEKEKEKEKEKRRSKKEKKRKKVKKKAQNFAVLGQIHQRRRVEETILPR